MRLKNKVSLVTGAGQGIGRAIALAFAKEGSAVVVNDIDFKTAEATAREITKKKKGEALAIRADVSQEDEVISMFEKLREKFGQIDILVNNAGIQTETLFLNLSVDEWDKIISVNLKGTFLCSQQAAQIMAKKKRGGKIINISSIHQFFPAINIAHYAASKGGIMMLTKVMAQELAEKKINVTCIAPGAVKTAKNEAIIKSSQRRAEMESKIPLGRMAEPEEIALVAVFLASEDSNYITGTTIYVDGGLTLGELKVGL